MLQSPKNKKTGFTLIETMLSIALFASIAGASSIALYSVEQQTNLDRTASSVASAIRRARLLSISLERDSPWGVKTTSSSIIVFIGTSYEEDNGDVNMVIDLPSSISATGLDEVQFAGATGIPNTSGIITLSTAYDSRTITIEDNGAIIN